MFRSIPVLVLLVAAVPCLAADDEDALFKKHGKKFVEVDGKFIRLPAVDFAKAEKTTLTDVRVGDAGLLQNAKITKIRRGDDDMIVTGTYTATTLTPDGLKLKQSFTTKDGKPIRVKGYSTKDMVDGDRWAAKPIVVVGTFDAPLAKGDGTLRILMAVPLAVSKEGLTREQFAELVKQGVSLEEKEKPKDESDPEAEAKELLDKAIQAQKANKRLRCIEICQEIVKNYPNTKASKEARSLLTKLGAK